MKRLLPLLLAPALCLGVSAQNYVPNARVQEKQALAREIKLQTSKLPQQAFKKAPGAVAGKNGGRHAAPILSTEKRLAKQMSKRVELQNPDDKLVTMVSQDFDKLTKGTETKPTAITLDDYYCIPSSLIGADGYGWGGYNLGQAGGALACGCSDGRAYITSPDFQANQEFTVSFIAKLPTTPTTEEDYLLVGVGSNGSQYLLDYTYGSMTGSEWYQVEFEFEGVPGEDIYLEIYTFEQDLVIDDVEIYSYVPAMANVKVLDYTDFENTSFIAHWEPVENATSYVVQVFELDEATDDLIEEPVYSATAKGVEHKVTIEPNKIYYYGVWATDGRNYSLYTDAIRVAALAIPKNVQFGFNEANTKMAMTWNAVDYAEKYYVKINQEHIANGNEFFHLADADFSDQVGEITLEESADYDNGSLFASLPGTSWSAYFGVSIPGGYGVVTADSFWGEYIDPVISSPTYDLSGALEGKVKVEFGALSSLGSQVEVTLTGKNEAGKYVVLSSKTLPALTSEFTNQEVELTNANGACYIDIAPVLDANGKGNLFLNNLKVSFTLEDGKTMNTTYCSKYFEDEIAEFDFMRSPFDNFSGNVTAYQFDAEGWIRLSSYASETVTLMGLDGIANVAADSNVDAPVVYYNLQGQRIKNPAEGVYIRVQGAKAEKIMK